MAADWLEIRQKQLKATRSRQNQVYLAFLSQKHVRCEADQSQGSWRVICNWFCNVPVFGINVTRYTFCCLKNIHIYIYIFLLDAQPPSSLLLAHSGGVSGGGLESAHFSRRVSGVLVTRSPLGTRSVPSSGTGPSQSGTGFGRFHR